METSASTSAADPREFRRLRAVELRERGWTQQQIADALGVTQGAVSQWLEAVRLGGPDALRARKHPGPAPKLSSMQVCCVRALLTRGAEASGFRGEVWTCARVAEAIERLCDVRFHPAHVSRMLKDWGYSPQKPVRRATQRDEAAIEAWRREVWPASKKLRNSSAGRSSS